MQNVPVTILNAADSGSQTGAAQDSGLLVSASFLVRFTDGTAAGSVRIQASNDRSVNLYTQQFVPSHWADIPNATVTVAAGATGMIVIPNMCFAFVRAVFTSTTPGSGNVNVDMNGLSV